jgi:alkanesulfonate monooxygenase SsuD/methylene tetrahydromethanopterin reductase-like flavin-dependent oxidoreductase (luciferase family)
MSLPVRLGVCLLPTSPWADARSAWVDIDQAGVEHIWTYDHLSWRDMRDGPWFEAMGLLSAVAAVTTTAKLGPLVASPNYRHPVLFAKQALTLADISNERFICAVGSGGTGWDATVLGQHPWERKERTARFSEFVEMLSLLFRQESTTHSGTYYAANEARMIPQRTVPIGVAATGPAGLRLTAQFADWWITFGDPVKVAELTDAECLASVAGQVGGLDSACGSIDRDPTTIRRLLLTGSSNEPWMSSVDSFVDLASRYAEVGITDIVVHAPQKESVHRSNPAVFEQLVALI